ncbi:hypothetical protein SETIT_5G168400v2 [Setaria italica]|uniref:DNA helicase Pif1-like 2B domain-containing protein n=1 Tax=Setaria italica TaxID=4555 RepID=A0A368R5X0_SETIT|nr:hypothetical protein SETIT_5G168400v2 [Setaria italica]
MSDNKRIQYNSTCCERRMRRKTEQGAIQHISNHHQGDSVHMEADENDGWLHRGDLGENKYRLDRLIECIFPNLNANMTNKEYITSRAILSTRNDWVDNINTKMIDMFQGVGRWCTIVSTPRLMIPITTIRRSSLTHLTPNGLPPHLLKLKIGCLVILLRNIDPANGLCNGTRLVVRGFQRNSIDAKIVLGQHAEKRIFLPRIPLCPSDDEMFPFQFKRKQFPIRLSFAMTDTFATSCTAKRCRASIKKYTSLKNAFAVLTTAAVAASILAATRQWKAILLAASAVLDVVSYVM